MRRGFPFAVLVILPLLLGAPQSIADSGPAQWRDQLKAAQKDGNSDAIIELTRRILADDAQDTDAWAALIQARIETEDYRRALASLNAWEKIEKPPLAVINDFRGDIHLAQDLPAEAERAWRASLSFRPDAYAVLSKLADLLESQERWSDALPFRNRATAAKPAAALFAARAGTLLHLHQWGAAIAGIHKANELDPTDETVQQWLPKLERLESTLDRIKSLDVRIATSLRDPIPLLDQAALFTGIGQPALALSNARRALAIAPGSIRARIQAGEAELDLHRPIDAAKSSPP